MPNPALETEFNAAHGRFKAAAEELVPLLIQIAFDSLREVLVDAQTIEVEGAFTEDLIRTLRIIRVLDEKGGSLYDVTLGHADRRVEDAIDETNSEYLDFLLDLTGDAYMGHSRIDHSDA